MSRPRFILLLDHDNIASDRFSLEVIIREWLKAIGLTAKLPTINEVVIRAYGGWFEGILSSGSRQNAHDFYQIHCPAILRIDGTYFRTSFSFADDLLVSKATIGDPGAIRVTHTVSSRTSKKDFLVANTSPACTDGACELKNLRRWIRSDRACFRASCPNTFASTFVRKEQKQVDMHLAVDLLVLAMGLLNGPGEVFHIALSSDDLDLIPAMATALALKSPGNSLTAIRFSPRNSYLDSSLVSAGTSIVTVP